MARKFSSVVQILKTEYPKQREMEILTLYSQIFAAYTAKGGLLLAFTSISALEGLKTW